MMDGLTWSSQLILYHPDQSVKWSLRSFAVEQLEGLHILLGQHVLQCPNVLPHLDKQPTIATAHLAQT